MSVGAGSIKRAAKRAAGIETDVIANPSEEVKNLVSAKEDTMAEEGRKKVKGEAKAAPKKAGKAAAPKAEKKAAAPKAEKKAAAPKAEKKTAAPKAEKKTAAPEARKADSTVLSRLDGKPIANESAQLGANERVQVTKEMPVYLL